MIKKAKSKIVIPLGGSYHYEILMVAEGSSDKKKLLMQAIWSVKNNTSSLLIVTVRVIAFTKQKTKNSLETSENQGRRVEIRRYIFRRRSSRF